jgi:hypothetical protein
MDDRKPERGTEAAIMARLRAMSEEIRNLRREFQATAGARRPPPERVIGADKSKARKKR